MEKEPDKATPEEEALAKTAELEKEHKAHYAEMNDEAAKHSDEKGNY